MLVTLEPNKEKVERYNKTAAELNASETDDMFFESIDALSDIFTPYHVYPNMLHTAGYHEYEMDYMDVNADNFHGIYVCELNDNHMIEVLTDYKEVRYNFESPIWTCDYGVADNASQIVDRYNELCEKYPEYMDKHSFVILMHPIFRDADTGWRWHKWGRYIGKFPKQCEYLCHERGIDMVYAFHIYEVEKCKED